MGKGSWSAPARHRSMGKYQRSYSAHAIGWGPQAEHGRGEMVVGVVARDRLSETLAALHLSGFGSNSRVLDGARGDLAAQLGRSGVSIEASDLYLGERPDESVVVLVHAPGRGDRVVQLLRGKDALDVHVVGKPEPDADLAPSPVEHELAAGT